MKGPKDVFSMKIKDYPHPLIFDKSDEHFIKRRIIKPFGEDKAVRFFDKETDTAVGNLLFNTKSPETVVHIGHPADFRRKTLVVVESLDEARNVHRDSNIEDEYKRISNEFYPGHFEVADAPQSDYDETHMRWDKEYESILGHAMDLAFKKNVKLGRQVGFKKNQCSPKTCFRGVTYTSKHDKSSLRVTVRQMHIVSGTKSQAHYAKLYDLIMMCLWPKECDGRRLNFPDKLNHYITLLNHNWFNEPMYLNHKWVTIGHKPKVISKPDPVVKQASLPTDSKPEVKATIPIAEEKVTPKMSNSDVMGFKDNAISTSVETISKQLGKMKPSAILCHNIDDAMITHKGVITIFKSDETFPYTFGISLPIKMSQMLEDLSIPDYLGPSWRQVEDRKIWTTQNEGFFADIIKNIWFLTQTGFGQAIIGSFEQLYEMSDTDSNIKQLKEELELKDQELQAVHHIINNKNAELKAIKDLIKDLNTSVGN